MTIYETFFLTLNLRYLSWPLYEVLSFPNVSDRHVGDGGGGGSSCRGISHFVFWGYMELLMTSSVM